METFAEFHGSNYFEILFFRVDVSNPGTGQTITRHLNAWKPGISISNTLFDTLTVYVYFF